MFPHTSLEHAIAHSTASLWVLPEQRPGKSFVSYSHQKGFEILCDSFGVLSCVRVWHHHLSVRCGKGAM
jgi:hypothetical protein